MKTTDKHLHINSQGIISRTDKDGCTHPYICVTNINKCDHAIRAANKAGVHIIDNRNYATLQHRA